MVNHVADSSGPVRRSLERFKPPPCPYCDLDISQLECTCFDYFTEGEYYCGDDNE